jgi:hypothetical protein
VGEKRANQFRGMKCDIKPLEVMSWGWYCPPVVEAFKKFSGIDLEPEEKWGAVVIKDWSKRYRRENMLDKKWREFAGIDEGEEKRNSGINKRRGLLRLFSFSK